MPTHLVFAHPNLDSFNGKMRQTAINTLTNAGETVSVSDLYQMDFKAAADAKDFTDLYHPDFFDLQIEQQAAVQNQTFAPDIQREHQLLEAADLIIFQFPLWWYSMPGLLKGYIDRVFSMGWAYGGGQALVGKKILVSMTTGAPEFAWTPDKRGTIKDIFKHLFVGTFGLCGMQVLEPFIVYGAKRISEQEKSIVMKQYEQRIRVLVK